MQDFWLLKITFYFSERVRNSWQCWTRSLTMV